jgi:hypothetical protein
VGTVYRSICVHCVTGFRVRTFGIASLCKGRLNLRPFVGPYANCLERHYCVSSRYQRRVLKHSSVLIGATTKVSEGIKSSCPALSFSPLAINQPNTSQNTSQQPHQVPIAIHQFRKSITQWSPSDSEEEIRRAKRRRHRIRTQPSPAPKVTTMHLLRTALLVPRQTIKG